MSWKRSPRVRRAVLVVNPFGASGASGSAGGNTYSHNRFGQYVRNRTYPVNPKSTRQVAIRSIMSTLAQRWKDVLTAPYRALWDLYAASVVMKNHLGVNIHLTGFQHYLRSNVARVQGGMAIVDVGPSVLSLPEKDSTIAVAFDVSDTEVEITFNDTLVWAEQVGAGMLVLQGKPQNVTRGFFGGPWRWCGTILGVAAPGVASPQNKTASWAMGAGQKSWIQCRISLADGRLSEPFQVSGSIVA